MISNLDDPKIYRKLEIRMQVAALEPACPVNPFNVWLDCDTTLKQRPLVHGAAHDVVKVVSQRRESFLLSFVRFLGGVHVEGLVDLRRVAVLDDDENLGVVKQLVGHNQPRKI
jgi:hypothetical protein